MKKYLLVSSLTSISIYIAGYLILTFQFVNPTINQFKKDLKTIFPLLKKDIETLNKFQLFAPSTFNNDASLFLNPLLKRSSKSKLLKIPKEDTKKLKKWRKKWPQHLDEIDYNSYSFKWLTQLKKYDHWKIDKIPLPALPPMYRKISYLTQLRLMQGMKKGNLKKALKEVRHLTRLLFSHQIQLANLFLVKILKQEQQAYQWAVANKKMNKGQWKVFTNEQLATFKRVFLVYGKVINLFTPHPYMDKLITQKPLHTGICSALDESFSFLLPLSPLLVNNYWPERGVRLRYLNMNRAMHDTAKRCPLKRYRPLWKDKFNLEKEQIKKLLNLSSGGKDLAEEFWFTYGPQLPLYRQTIGLFIYTTLTMDQAFAPYQK